MMRKLGIDERTSCYWSVHELTCLLNTSINQEKIFWSFDKFAFVKRERASGWLVSFFSQFRGRKIPIQVGVWKGHSGISWIFNEFISYNWKLHGSSWTLRYQLVLSSIPSFLIIFLLYGLRLIWWDIDLFGGDYNDKLFYGLI